LKKIARRFIDVLAQPRKCIKSFDDNDDHPLLDASLFAASVSVVHIMIMLPAYRLAGIESDALTYVLSDTVLTLFFLFLNGSIFHVCARLVRGQGTYQSSIVAILYLTAFSVISGIFTLPLAPKILSLTQRRLELPPLDEIRKAAERLVQTPTGLICSSLLVATALYRWICTIGVFMTIHRVGRAKGVLLACWVQVYHGLFF
jgi:hypothetical protein